MKATAFLIIICCSLGSAAQNASDDCTRADFERMLQEAKQHLIDQRFDKADQKLRVARVCQPQEALLVDSLLGEVRRAVVRQAYIAENAALAFRIEKTDPTLALDIARENLLLDPNNQAAISAFKEILSNEQHIFYKTTGRGHEGMILRALFLTDSAVLTGSADGSLRIWNLQGIELKKFGNANIPVSAIAVDSKSQIILSGHDDGSIARWDASGNLLHVLKNAHDSLVSGIEFLGESQQFVSAGTDGKLVRWNADGTRAKILKNGENAFAAIATGRSGTTIATVQRNGTLQMLRPDSTPIFSKKWSSRLNSVAIAADERSILTGSRDSSAQLWSSDGQLLRCFVGCTDWVTSVAFSPDGRHILIGSADQIGRIWEIGGASFKELKGHTNLLLSGEYNRTGDRVVTAGFDKTFKIWCPEKLLFKKIRPLLPGEEAYFDWNDANFLVESTEGRMDSTSVKPYFQHGLSRFAGFEKKIKMNEKLLLAIQNFSIASDSEAMKKMSEEDWKIMRLQSKIISPDDFDAVQMGESLVLSDRYFLGYESGSFAVTDGNFNNLVFQKQSTGAIQKIMSNPTEELFALVHENVICLWKMPEVFVRDDVEKMPTKTLTDLGFKK